MYAITPIATTCMNLIRGTFLATNPKHAAMTRTSGPFFQRIIVTVSYARLPNVENAIHLQNAANIRLCRRRNRASAFRGFEESAAMFTMTP
jgi:hypothetical protein